MAVSQFDQFLYDATICDPDGESTLGPDRLYGLYISWCAVTNTRPRRERSFWAAMRRRVDPAHNGLRMQGPAAADYLLSSYPNLV
ncbi:hypothetical protein [Arthrobacter globiformis]|uniref:hypothetical protein n=1 Tax=Arthrobacter globiformis TaxID=1665 RepID=UPI000B40EC6B|nr:hypothetical protein [Arthrobacter globiformis]